MASEKIRDKFMNYVSVMNFKIEFEIYEFRIMLENLKPSEGDISLL